MKVKARAEAIGSLRFTCVFLMETLAGWTPTTPEMEAKTLFGRHIWIMAQSADALGRRAHELRAVLHYSRPPRAPFLAALEQLRGVTATAERIAAFYDIALGALVDTIEAYRGDSESLIDEPSYVVLDDIDGRIQRMRRDRAQLLADMPQFAGGNSGADVLRLAFAHAGAMVDYSAALEQEAV